MARALEISGRGGDKLNRDCVFHTIFLKGNQMKRSDEVILSIAGDGFTNAITGWTDVRITRGIERCPNDFEISMSEVFPGVDQIIAREGMACTIDIGQDRVITGWIDQVINSIGPEAHPIRIVGRGYC